MTTPKKTTRPAPVGLPDLLPPVLDGRDRGRTAPPIRWRSGDARRLASTFLQREVLGVPPAWLSGPLAGPGADAAVQGLREASEARTVAVAATQTPEYRAAVEVQRSPAATRAEKDAAEAYTVPLSRESERAIRAHEAAQRIALRAAYEVDDDLADLRRETLATARDAAVVQARESVAALADALTVVLAADLAADAGPASYVLNAPGGLTEMRTLLDHVGALTTREEEAR